MFPRERRVCPGTRTADTFGRLLIRHPVLLQQVEMPSRSGAGQDTEAG